MPSTFDAIKLFPAPKNLTDIRSWFGLINQVAEYGQLRKTLDPFRLFLSPKVNFEWTTVLQMAFEAGKLEIVKAIEKGVEIFNPRLHMCLRTDWSKAGMGYLLPLPKGVRVRGCRPGMLHGRLAHMPCRVSV